MEIQTLYGHYLEIGDKKSKFKVGDKVKYLPTLSGLRKNQRLMIRSIYFKETDELSLVLGVDFVPTFVYNIETINGKAFSLGAIETDLSNSNLNIMETQINSLLESLRTIDEMIRLLMLKIYVKKDGIVPLL